MVAVLLCHQRECMQWPQEKWSTGCADGTSAPEAHCPGLKTEPFLASHFSETHSVHLGLELVSIWKSSCEDETSREGWNADIAGALGEWCLNLGHTLSGSVMSSPHRSPQRQHLSSHLRPPHCSVLTPWAVLPSSTSRVSSGSWELQGGLRRASSAGGEDGVQGGAGASPLKLRSHFPQELRSPLRWPHRQLWICC